MYSRFVPVSLIRGKEPNVGGSEMASREKKPLAPSKAKQKASNDSGLPSNEIKSRKGKSLANLKQQQLARDILEAVATGSQLPPKIEASLPRKKVLRNLKRKQKLRVVKANLIKSKVTRKVANRGLCRITSDIKKGVRGRRVKLPEESPVKVSDTRVSEYRVNDTESESTGIETINRSAKNNLRTKKTKFVWRTSGDIENEDVQDKDTDSGAGSSTKNSPKLNRRGKGSESPDSLTKGVKSTKFLGFRRNNTRERDIGTKNTEGDIKYTKGRKGNNKDIDYSRASAVDTKFSKSLLEAKSSIDLTIDEVIASMLSDSEIDSQQGATEKVEGKVTRSRKMVVEENIVADIEIKKEPEDDTKILLDGECLETESFQNAIQLRKRSSTSISQRSLRNGKLRQSDSGISADLDLKKRRRLNSDDPVNSEVSVDNIADSNVDTESCFSESSGNDSQTVMVAAKDESCLKQETVKSYEESSQTGLETENNNNSDRVDRASEVGPTLRSKTKAKSTEVEIKNDNIKVEYTRIVPKNTEAQEELKKVSNLDQVRKDNILAKFADKSKSRRSSLNIDMKKTVNSFYSTDKSDGNPKSQIDQMIENIKLTIAKSIESKIFGPEKGLGLSKNFEVPKIEEIIAPLSAESQKLGLEEATDEDKSTISKNEIKSEDSENSVPKVADTAKEIEKLVMGDIEPAETHSQNIQETESPDTGGSNNTHNASEAVHATENCESGCKVAEHREEPSENSTAAKEPEKCSEQSIDDQTKTLDDSKRSTGIRKSPRITDKASSPESASTETAKKLSKLTTKTVHISESSEESASQENTNKSTSEDAPSQDKPLRNESKKVTASEALSNHAEAASDQGQERLVTEETKTAPAIASEARVSLNVSVESEDAETLENISKEVRTLVTEDECKEQLESIAEDGKQEESSAKDTVESPPSLSEVSLPDNAEEEEAAPNIVTDVPEESTTEGKSEAAESPKETESSTLEMLDDAKKDRSSNQILATSDSDSSHNTSCSDASNVAEEPEKESEASPKSDKSKQVSACGDVTSAASAELKKEVSSKISDHGKLAAEEEDEEDDEKLQTERIAEEQKSPSDEKKRVLRMRDKTKRIDKEQTSSSRERDDSSSKAKADEEGGQKRQGLKEIEGAEEVQEAAEEKAEGTPITEDTDDATNNGELDANESEPQARTRRSREVKKRKEDQLVALKNKRAKREVRKSDQQNKEETLLDNEVATINENNRAFLTKYENGTDCSNNFRGFSEGGRDGLDKRQGSADNLRSKSENDLSIAKEPGKTARESRLSRNLSENHMTKESENIDILDGDSKGKTPEISQKDSDETSTSGESSSSVNVTPKILETPEDKAKKESILRLLGLESLEKAAERLSHQKAKKEQYTGTLKTVIRVQKDKEKDKRRSRSPLKMVLKQGRGDGEGDSPEFYTIQKEFGTSGLGDSSSGANRKFSTNHRHSCDEDNEDAAPKDRQSLVIPEKSSSFSIHPGRLCADVCCYCFGKFGSLDTPMHLAQMKSDERRKKILNIERHLTKDSCLCDACYRHVDRKANTSPTNMQAKPQKQHRQLMVSKCSARDCRDAARHHVKRRWLLKIKAGLQKQVDIDWESSQHTSMSFCVSHYSKIERFLTCALCKRRLARNHTHQLANAETEELNQLLGQQGVPVLLAAGTFVCKLCRYFTQLQLKYKDVENMNTNHRSFFKSYRKRILHYHDIEVLENEDEDSSQNQSKDKDKRKKPKCQAPPKSGTSKSPDGTASSISEKSTLEPSKTEGAGSETDNETNRKASSRSMDGHVVTDVQFLGIESTVEKLKKRKLLEMHPYTTPDPTAAMSCESPNEVVEILAMDKEVTLTRLPKRPRTSNDITPVVQRLGANPSISVRTLFPGEEEMNLHANIEFTNVREITPQGWEKCATMIQYDRDTKLLWQELQRPYGNQSSFLRHLILLEKYYRSGDLVLAPNASRNAINYSTSVQNRLISYEGPEKMDEPIMEPISSEYHNSRRLSGGYVLERDRLSLPSTSTMKATPGVAQQPPKASPPRVLKLNPGVSIIKKPPPNLQRLSLPSTSATTNGNAKRKDQRVPVSAGGKVFQLSEPDFKRLQSLKKQKQLLAEKQQSMSPVSGSGSSASPPNLKPTTAQYQKAQLVAHTQFQKHLRMQQEMLSRQSRGDFEPLICDIRSLANENSPTQNLLHNLNLPKSIQVTTKTTHHIPILPKIPRSLTVIPQTVTRPADK
ncbi:enhanced adult sensory threshold isoform X2 [Andrena cerasifolii]|uniref:enhanced adult sensory threshold isoform X2 n=1 Tax=Andrena cerasifolii TaxID=2819439 RepID=UPI004038130D